MTPGARLQTALEIAAKIDESPVGADRVLGAAFRERRYAGSKDRRAITAAVYSLLRCRARLDWWIGRAGSPPGNTMQPGWRSRLIAHLVLADGAAAGEVAALFSGAKYCPAPLNDAEATLALALEGQSLEHADMPKAAGLEIPPWLEDALTAAWGESLETEMAALNAPAPVDLRVNTLKATREEAIIALANDGVAAAPTPLSPLGLRLTGASRLDDTTAHKEGWIEVQDEGSQLIALIAGAAAGMTVYDICAGAGGKALALASIMGNEGLIIAADADETRLKRMIPRLRRSGASIVEIRPRDADAWPPDQRQGADRVLVDAPCSGTGTWRRHPEARWRLTAEALAEYQTAQGSILDAAAALVKPGGRLVYATCSVLAAENTQQVTRFLGSHADFALLPAADAWAESAGGPYSFFGPCPEPYLSLTPATTNTDGFFAAVLQKRGS